MILRSSFLIILVVSFSIGVFDTNIINSAYAKQENESSNIQGKVLDKIDITNYTYAEIDTGNAKVWAAGPTTALKIGDTVTISTVMPMQDFYSESMKRNFSLIYFISRFVTETETDNITSSGKTSGHGQITRENISIAGIDKLAGGKSISEIHTEKDKLNGKTIQVRGQVTRFAAEIMGKNWLHIQDSSSFDDLTVTTDNTVAVGDVVIIEGKLELDKDFDYGYLYPVIIQNALVTKE